MYRLAIRLFGIGCLLLLTACASSPTRSATHYRNTSNICTLFKANPSWYWEALDSYDRWKVPISIQMAIVKHESDFQAGAKPPDRKLFGIISWVPLTSAYGYAQAINGTWKEYQRETHHYSSRRDQFGDAVDFIGWYANKAHEEAGISLTDPYNLYLAYHEGIGGYLNRSYRNKPDIINVALSVRRLADIYRWQIHRCKDSLPLR